MRLNASHIISLCKAYFRRLSVFIHQTFFLSATLPFAGGSIGDHAQLSPTHHVQLFRDHAQLHPVFVHQLALTFRYFALTFRYFASWRYFPTKPSLK